MMGLIESRGRSLSKAQRLVLAGVLVLALLSVVRLITGTGEIASSGTFGAALRLAIPIMLAGLGGLYAERTGVVNIGLEGMLIMGTWFGAWAGWLYGPWWGALIGLAGGLVGGLIHAVATVTFKVDHIVSGVAINILALGGMRFLSVVTYEVGSGGGATQSPPVTGSIPKTDIPFLSGGSLFGWQTPDFFGWLETRHWFFVSDLAGLLRGLTGDLSWLTLIAIALIPLTYWFLWKTPTGLRMRACGEHPVAAESLGTNVYRMKYLGVLISGALAGFGGAFLVIEFASIYREGQTGGRGFIGLAAMIIGNWRPIGTAAAAGLFGFADALRLRTEVGVHSLLLFVAIAAFLFAAWFLVRGMARRQPASEVRGEGASHLTLLRRGLGLAAAGGVVLLWFLITDKVPSQFVAFTPHIVTLVVMSFAAQRLRMPTADGKRYSKGQELF